MKTFKRVEVIDFFRGLSIVGVVMYHLISLYMTSLPSIIKYAANVGSSGVLIFFFCSGFSLHYSQQQKPVTIMDFLKKKISNIYLPYMAVIFISALIPVMVTPVGGNRVVAVLSHVFQFRIFNNMYFDCFGGHWWYMGTLFQFFLMFFILERIMKKIGEARYLIFCCMISISYVICLVIFDCENSRILSRVCFKYLFEYGFGMVVANAHLSGRLSKYKIKQSELFWVGIIGVVLLGISSKNAIGRLLNDVPGFIGIVCLFYWLYRLENNWINHIILWFGNISFEWYLTHMLIFSCVFMLSDGTIKADFMCATIALVTSCLAALIFKKTIRVIDAKWKYAKRKS